MSNYADPQWVDGYKTAVTDLLGEIDRRKANLDGELVADGDRFPRSLELELLAAHCHGTLEGLASGLALVEDIATGRVAS